VSNDDVLSAFLRAAEAWVCDGYAFDVRYLAEIKGNDMRVWSASVAVNPLPAQHDVGFRIELPNIAVGQIQGAAARKSDLMRLLKEATSGEVKILGRRLTLGADQPLDYFSEMAYRDRWFSDLHLQVSGDRRPQPTSIALAAIDTALRRSTPPFDGLADAASWLGLSVPGTTTNPPSLVIRVGPPVDLIFDGCSLAQDRLTLKLHAHPKFDLARIELAVRAVPGVALDGRRQVADKIVWKRVREGRRSGLVQVDLHGADNALVMLLIEDSTVRRQWFTDPAKARSNRLLAVQHFDKDLRMTRQAVFESTDSAKFEHGVAALLFLLGFTASVQLESDAPDLIVTTPGGKLVIVECTTRVADFATKIGKLVDRRGALSRYLTASGHPAQVVTVLVCRLPRDQIAMQADELRSHNTVLLTSEDLQASLDSIRIPTDPDQMLDTALAGLTRVAMSS
jgi:hypothetical protein